MADVVAAHDSLKARVAAAAGGIPVIFRDEDNDPLPDEPAPFVYVEIDADRGAVIEMGGGRGNNRYRHGGELVAYLFVPRGWGMRSALTRAETIAAALRSFRDANVSCAEASVMPAGEGESLAPPGVESPAGNYSAAMVVARFRFDQVG